MRNHYLFKIRQRQVSGILIFLFFVNFPFYILYSQLTKEPAKTRTKEVIAWENLKYGMFIHYSMNTYAGFEYDNGENPASFFKPTNLDVKQWVHTAKIAGMKYIVLTTKHQSGFCLWDSKVMWKGKEYDYNVAGAGLKTDIVDEFVKACREEGIKPAFYYCILDPHNEGKVDWKSLVTDEYYTFLRAQIEELHTKYKGIAEQWLDVSQKLSKEQHADLYQMIKRLNPGCMVITNDGFGNGVEVGYGPTDIVVGERTLPPATGHNPVMTVNGEKYYIPMEVCQTIAQNWFCMDDDPPKTLLSIYYWYEQCMKLGTNFLLDVPVDRSGVIPKFHVDRLIELKKVIDNPALLPKPKSLTYKKPVKASSEWKHSHPEYLPEYAVDEDTTSRWIGNEGLDNAWLEVDLEKNTTFNTVFISEEYSPCIKEFDLQYKKDDNWVTILSVKDFKGKINKKFPSVEARYVRINITKYTDLANHYNVLKRPGNLKPVEGPSISEFQLFNN